MNIVLAVLQAVLGGFILFFIVGFVIMKKFFPNTTLFERIIYGITLSITASIIISLILSYIGIFSFLSFIIGYAIVVLAVILIARLME